MVAKLDLRKMPRDYRRAFGWMLAPMSAFHADPLAFIERPRAAFARLEQRMSAIFDRELQDGGPEAFTRRMFEPIARMTAAQWAAAPRRLAIDTEQRRRRVARSETGAQLLALIDAAHVCTRNSPFVAILHPEKHGRAALRTLNRILRIRDRRGEARTDLVLDAIAMAWEEVYQPYLQAVWKLSQLGLGRAPGQAPGGGKLMKELSVLLGPSQASIVESDALRIRDAVAHRHVTPEARGAATLRNKDRWTARYERRELEAVLGRMMKASTYTFVEAMNAFTMEAVMMPLLPAMPEFVQAVVANNPVEIARTSAIMKALEQSLSSDIASLYGSASP